MKKPLLFCALIGVLSGCYQEADISPNLSSLAAEVVGLYRTNSYLDPSQVATSADKMPYAELKAESDSTVTLIYTTFYPTRSSQLIQHVLIKRESDSIQLQIANQRLGMVKIDRIFTNNGMEKQGQLLRLTMPDDLSNSLNFSGIQ